MRGSGRGRRGQGHAPEHDHGCDGEDDGRDSTHEDDPTAVHHIRHEGGDHGAGLADDVRDEVVVHRANRRLRLIHDLGEVGTGEPWHALAHSPFGAVHIRARLVHPAGCPGGGIIEECTIGFDTLDEVAL